MEEATMAQEPKLSFVSKLGLIFSKPGQVFENLKHYPDWLIPTLLILAFTLASAYMLKDLGVQIQKEKVMNSERLTDEQKEVFLQRMEEGGTMQTVVMPLLGSVVYIFASFALVAALFLFSGNVILGGKANFSTLLSVYAWGFMVSIPETIIKIPMMLAKGSLHVYTSLAIFFDMSQSETVLFKIANAIDIFALWRVVLWSIGFGIVYNFSKGKSYGVIVSWYAIWILISITTSSLLGGFI